jgi:hypothetical protein
MWGLNVRSRCHLGNCQTTAGVAGTYEQSSVHSGLCAETGVVCCMSCVSQRCYQSCLLVMRYAVLLLQVAPR